MARSWLLHSFYVFIYLCVHHVWYVLIYIHSFTHHSLTHSQIYFCTNRSVSLLLGKVGTSKNAKSCRKGMRKLAQQLRSYMHLITAMRAVLLSLVSCALACCWGYSMYWLMILEWMGEDKWIFIWLHYAMLITQYILISVLHVIELLEKNKKEYMAISLPERATISEFKCLSYSLWAWRGMKLAWWMSCLLDLCSQEATNKSHHIIAKYRRWPVQTFYAASIGSYEECCLYCREKQEDKERRENK